jgi:heat shock protein HslJ
MMRHRSAVLLATSLLVAGCARSATERSSPPGGLPIGKSFVATSVTEGGRDRPLVAGTKIVVSFDGAPTPTAGTLSAAERAEQLVAITAGCNTMSGVARLDSGNLVVGRIATTAMGCDAERSDQDAWLAGILGDGPAMTIDGSQLVLRDATVVITLTEAPRPSPR